MGDLGVPIDRAGHCLYPFIAYFDPRSEPQARRLQDWLGGARQIYEITGQAGSRLSVSRLLWLRENEPKVFGSIHKWLSPEDYILWKLSGEYATDYSMASRTLALDQRSLTWSEQILGPADLSIDLLPSVHQSGTMVGQVTQAAAADTGLPVGAVVATGGHDHLCGALGAGVVKPGTVLDSMGTVEAGLLLRAGFDPNERLFQAGYAHYAHVIPGQYIIMFGTAGGGVLDWVVRQFWPEAAEPGESRSRAFASALEAAEAIPPGSEGLLWLPHLSGIVGLTTAHGRGHFVRALFEGLSFWLRDTIGLVEEASGIPTGDEIIGIGGGTRARLWMQIKADVTGRTVRVVTVPEVVSLGAALLAGVGAGVLASADEAAASVVRPMTVYEPDPDRHDVYVSYFQSINTELRPALRSAYQRIREFPWTGRER